MRVGRAIAGWLTDWRNLVAVAAIALVALVVVSVGAGFRERDRYYHQLQGRDAKISTLSDKVDELQAELEAVLAAHTDADRQAVVDHFEELRQSRATAATKPPAAHRSRATPRPSPVGAPPTTRPSPSSSTTTTPPPSCIPLCLTVPTVPTLPAP